MTIRAPTDSACDQIAILIKRPFGLGSPPAHKRSCKDVSNLDAARNGEVRELFGIETK
jgi:hypothetical protein